MGEKNDELMTLLETTQVPVHIPSPNNSCEMVELIEFKFVYNQSWLKYSGLTIRSPENWILIDLLENPNEKYIFLLIEGPSSFLTPSSSPEKIF